jgi:RNA-directed DNA polymerase
MLDSRPLKALARSFLAGEQSVEQIFERASGTLGRRWGWLRPLARRYVDAMAEQTRPRYRDVVQFLRNDRRFARVRRKFRDELSVESWMLEPQRMQPVAAAERWDLPPIESAAALTEWLHLNPGELEWLADLKGLLRHGHPGKLAHYHYRVLAKANGEIRLIEAPKSRLKHIQRQILARILDKIPAHSASHGFVSGRSIRTFTAPHAGRRIVLKMDLHDFFPSFAAARIAAFFRTAGYPESVADLLGGLCTNWSPRELLPGLEFREARDLYCRPHLPQGAPTSPALANLCFYRTDCRLAGLARSAGAVYTRYADDLAFSGGDEFARGVERFAAHVAAIVREEGFAVNHRKTRIMRQGVRQQLAGLVVNERPNVKRADFDRLKAILTNCARSGPEGQNREVHHQFRSHLEGRVNFVETINPARGKQLRAIFDRIRWVTGDI